MILKNSHILIHSDGFWNGPVRVRHRMPLVWAREGNRVLWMEQPPFPPHEWLQPLQFRRSLRGPLEQIEDRFYVSASPPALPKLHGGGTTGKVLKRLHRPFMISRIRKHLSALKMTPDIFVLFQQPSRTDLWRAFPGCLKIYYCHDLYGYGTATKKMQEEEIQCCRQANVVFTTAAVVRERLTRYNPHTYHIPHAVDLDWWEEANFEFPQEFEKIPGPRMTFAGAINAKLDLALLEDVARRNPNWHLILIGPVNKSVPNISSLRRLPNMHFLGSKNPADLPAYYHHSNVLMFPYTLQKAREAIGLPLKFYEYCLAGKPIISTPFTEFELEQQQVIRVRRTAEGWSDLLTEIERLPPEDLESESRIRIQLAKKNTYSQRIELQREILESLPKFRRL